MPCLALQPTSKDFPSSDELKGQFTHLLNQSSEERRNGKSERDIMVDHIKQDMYIQAMKEFEKAEIETLKNDGTAAKMNIMESSESSMKTILSIDLTPNS